MLNFPYRFGRHQDMQFSTQRRRAAKDHKKEVQFATTFGLVRNAVIKRGTKMNS